MSPHYCLMDGRNIVCLCVRGQNHDVDLFDVPVGEEREEPDE